VLCWLAEYKHIHTCEDSSSELYAKKEQERSNSPKLYIIKLN